MNILPITLPDKPSKFKERRKCSYKLYDGDEHRVNIGWGGKDRRYKDRRK